MWPRCETVLKNAEWAYSDKWYAHSMPFFSFFCLLIHKKKILALLTMCYENLAPVSRNKLKSPCCKYTPTIIAISPSIPPFLVWSWIAWMNNSGICILMREFEGQYCAEILSFGSIWGIVAGCRFWHRSWWLNIKVMWSVIVLDSLAVLFVFSL